ncbi:epsin [Aspergillus clavatus NRRL 1]|uniref:EH domain binding protein epsin 2 n=1 Tax=Aspergillus clavatus (strain ATCC 1007 / CBS 513.65 / DSM 816 / NCTC 3887 / NRRL 1 / QM 1276 / 107) TaxID=344612 RepID=A1CU98_ASPCL|nr:EH domain binding protein epsin 2 [Aspergillus clavatus NRRL 1]EAW06885.1 EH domain binding protein epsin 2 [Aspergillus clavatus NRRL 1]
MSKVVRSVKNVTKGYSSVQVKVRNATSNDPWGPTGTEMAEIAGMTFSSPTDFYEIMDMLDKRLNDKGKNWRHVLKSLKVLDYCLHEGSELVVTWARKNVYIIKTLREFQYVDEDGRDVGQNVRVAAKELTTLILDEDRLRSERSDRKLWKSRVNGLDEYQSHGAEPSRRSDRRERRRPAGDDEDVEYRLAIEASKAEAEEERKRRERQTMMAEDDEDLAKAIKLSKEEEELRKRELEESNAQSLFDDTPVPTAQAQPTGYNQGYQQQGAVDWFGNPINPQQPLSTGYLNNQYAQATGFQNQPTGMPNGYANGFQSQPNAFDHNPYGQLQNNFLQPQATLQPQQTAFSPNNPYGTDVFSQQQQQQQGQENFSPSGSNNPWAHNGAPQANTLQPMPTGSNNPFAARTQFQARPHTSTGPPSLNTLAEERATNQFTSSNPITNFQAPAFTAAPAPPKSTPPQMNNPHHARLNALLSTGEGQDTFGNVGDLRIPAQHTAPGTFVNSAGQGLDRLRATHTGNNPFYNQQQFVPQSTGFAQSTNNPWGGQQSYQQQHQAGGSLIDL